jgi:hypothetical protein
MVKIQHPELRQRFNKACALIDRNNFKSMLVQNVLDAIS